jgi:hypothetical protein
MSADLAAATRSPALEIIEKYHRTAPSAQNAVDIFDGDWSSVLPAELDAESGGFAELFDDPRVNWMVDELGGVEGWRILELGPLEGAHTHLLETRHRAAEIVAVEANERAYLKCLVVKELLGMARARFLLGDCDRYMAELAEASAGDDPPFDLVTSCGVLYHMEHPARHVELLCRSARSVFVWTHYFDRELIDAIGPQLADRFSAHSPVDASQAGPAHTVHRHQYLDALGWGGFCGGGREFANWMELDDIRATFAHHGFDVVAEGFHHMTHAHGPAIALLAQKA